MGSDFKDLTGVLVQLPFLPLKLQGIKDPKLLQLFVGSRPGERRALQD